MAQRYWVPGTKKRKGHYRTPPTLSPAEKARRGRVAKTKAIPGMIRATKKVGYEEILAKLRPYQDRIKSPEKLAGWYRTRPEVMRARGAPRAKYRKYPKAARRMTKTTYRRYLAKRRT